MVSGVAFLLLLLFFLLGYEQTWRLWKIPAMSPPFADLRVITHGADSIARGLDPLVSNPGDPWGRPLNYPRIWQSLYSVGINKSHTIVLGLGIILSFLAGVVMLMPNASNTAYYLVTVALLSPAVLLGIERANVDLFIFFLVSLSIANAKRSLAMADGVILLATALKLYPIFGISLLLRGTKSQFIRHAIVVCAILFIYLIVTWSDLRLISHATPRASDLSYGMNVAWMRLAGINPTLGILLRIICSALALLAACLLYAGCTHRHIITPRENADDSLALDSFRVGSSIYLGTFVLGNNWDYRLVFLILCIPQLASWVASSSRRIKWLSMIAVFAMIVSMWYLVIGAAWGLLASALLRWMPIAGVYPWFVDEIFNWLLFLILSYLFSVSLPSWAKVLVASPSRPTGPCT